MNDIMLDLETFSTDGNAIVLSVGMVRFSSKEGITDPFYMEFTDLIDTQERKGGIISPSTARWWMEQSPVARNVFATQPIDPKIARPQKIQDALSEIMWYIVKNPKTRIWGNGSDFDNVILANLFKRHGRQVPWSFSNNRCYRTLKNLHANLAMPKVGCHRIGEHHNALDDARTQAVHALEIFKCLAPPTS